MSKERKAREAKALGMNKSTAHQRLVKDTLFRLAVSLGYKCYRCNKPLDRETLSIEHKIDWYHSDNPAETYFDQDNIAFSHNLCNTKASAAKYRLRAADMTKEEFLEHDRKRSRAKYCPEKRKQYYKNTGK